MAVAVPQARHFPLEGGNPVVSGADGSRRVPLTACWDPGVDRTSLGFPNCVIVVKKNVNDTDFVI